MATPRKVRIDGINATFMVEADTDEQLESAIDELAAKYRGKTKGQIAQSMWAEQGMAPGGRGTSDFADREAKLETAPQGLWENVSADIGSSAETPGQAIRDLASPRPTGGVAAPRDASPVPMQDFRRQRKAEDKVGLPFEPVIPESHKGVFGLNPYAIQDKLTNLDAHLKRNVTEQGPVFGNAQNIIDTIFFPANQASDFVMDKVVGAQASEYGGLRQPFQANFQNPDGTSSQRGVMTEGSTDPDGRFLTPTQSAAMVPDVEMFGKYKKLPRAITKGVAGGLEDFATLENVLEMAGIAATGPVAAAVGKTGFALTSIKMAWDSIPLFMEAVKTQDEKKIAEFVRMAFGAGLMFTPAVKSAYKGAKAGVKAVKDVRSVGDDIGKALAEGLADAGRTAKNPNAAAAPVTPPDSSFSTGAKSDFINPLEGVVTSDVKTGRADVRTEGQTLPLPTVAQRANLEGQIQGVTAMHPGSRVDMIDDWTAHVTLPDGHVVPVKVAMDIPITPEVLWETNRAEALRRAESAGVNLDPKAKFEDVKGELERVLGNEQAQGVTTAEGIKVHGGQKRDATGIEAKVAEHRDKIEAENMRRPMGKRRSQQELTQEENAYRRWLYETTGEFGSEPRAGAHEGIHTSWADVEPAVKEWAKDYAKDTDPAQLEEKFAEFYEFFQLLDRDGITPDMLTGDRVMGEVFPEALTKAGGEFANVPVGALRLPLDIYQGKYGRQGTGAPAPAKLTPEQRRAAAADTAARMRPPEPRPVQPAPPPAPRYAEYARGKFGEIKTESSDGKKVEVLTEDGKTVIVDKNKKFDPVKDDRVEWTDPKTGQKLAGKVLSVGQKTHLAVEVDGGGRVLIPKRIATRVIPERPVQQAAAPVVSPLAPPPAPPAPRPVEAVRPAPVVQEPVPVAPVEPPPPPPRVATQAEMDAILAGSQQTPRPARPPRRPEVPEGRDEVYDPATRAKETAWAALVEELKASPDVRRYAGQGAKAGPIEAVTRVVMRRGDPVLREHAREAAIQALADEAPIHPAVMQRDRSGPMSPLERIVEAEEGPLAQAARNTPGVRYSVKSRLGQEPREREAFDVPLMEEKLKAQRNPNYWATYAVPDMTTASYPAEAAIVSARKTMRQFDVDIDKPAPMPQRDRNGVWEGTSEEGTRVVVTSWEDGTPAYAYSIKPDNTAAWAYRFKTGPERPADKTARLVEMTDPEHPFRVAQGELARRGVTRDPTTDALSQGGITTAELFAPTDSFVAQFKGWKANQAELHGKVRFEDGDHAILTPAEIAKGLEDLRRGDYGTPEAHAINMRALDLERKSLERYAPGEKVRTAEEVFRDKDGPGRAVGATEDAGATPGGLGRSGLPREVQAPDPGAPAGGAAGGARGRAVPPVRDGGGLGPAFPEAETPLPEGRPGEVFSTRKLTPEEATRDIKRYSDDELRRLVAWGSPDGDYNVWPKAPVIDEATRTIVDRVDELQRDRDAAKTPEERARIDQMLISHAEYAERVLNRDIPDIEDFAYDIRSRQENARANTLTRQDLEENARQIIDQVGVPGEPLPFDFREGATTGAEVKQFPGKFSSRKIATDTLPPDSKDTVVRPGVAYVNPRYSTRTLDENVKLLREVNDKTGWWDDDQIDGYSRDMASVARMVLAHKDELDFDPSVFKALKQNSDYPGGSLDFSTLCRRRGVLQATVEEVQRRKGSVLTADEIFAIRDRLKSEGEQVDCAACYVASRWRNLKTGIDKVVKGYTDANGVKHPPMDVPMEMLTSVEGMAQLARERPDVYKEVSRILRANTMAKALEARTEFRPGDLLNAFTPKAVAEVNARSGLRWQSWSDFEAPHILDAMQAIGEMSQLRLYGHAYSKEVGLPEIFGPTGLAVNMSLIPNGQTGFDAAGKLAWNKGESFADIEYGKVMRDRYPNVGFVAIGVSDAHIEALLAEPTIDYVIPYHVSGMNKGHRVIAGMDKWKDYSSEQIYLDKTTGKKSDKSIHWNEWKGHKVVFDRLLRERNLIAPFQRFKKNPNYWKLLVDRRVYDANGKVIQQRVVQPEFDMEAAERILNDTVRAGGYGAKPNAKVVEEVADGEKQNLSTRRLDTDPVKLETRFARATRELLAARTAVAYALGRRPGDLNDTVAAMRARRYGFNDAADALEAARDEFHSSSLAITFRRIPGSEDRVVDAADRFRDDTDVPPREGAGDSDTNLSTRRLDTEYKDALKEAPWLKNVDANVGKPAPVPTKYVRANAGRTPEERNLLDSFARTRAVEGLPRVKHDRDTVKKAKQQWLADKAGEELRVMTDLRRGTTRFTDEDNLIIDFIRAERNAEANKLTGEARKKAIEESVVLEKIRGENMTEIARAMRIVRDPDESPRQRMERWFNGAVFAPKDPKTAKGIKNGDPKAIKDQVDHVEKLLNQLKKDGVDLSKATDAQIKDPLFVAEQIRKVFARKATFNDKVFEYWSNSILSGPQTQVVNMFSNLVSLAWEYGPQRLVQTAVSGAIRGDRVEFDSLMHAYKALLSGVAYREGLRNMAQAWKTEAGVLTQKTRGGLAFEGGGRDYPRISLGAGPNWLVDAGRKVGIDVNLGRVVRAPGYRLLKASDEFAKGIIGQMEAAASAYKIAKSEGLSGEKLGKRMNDLILDYESDAWMKAVTHAELITFQKELGPIGKWFLKGRNLVSVFKYIVPFVTTPWNVMATGVVKSPLGALALPGKIIAAAKSDKSFRDAVKNGTPEGEAALRAMTEQILAFTTAYALSGILGNETVEDGIVITGPMQYQVDDRGTREAKYRSLPPSSVIWKDKDGEIKSASFARVEPLNTIWGLLADGAALLRSDNKKDAVELLNEGWRRFQGMTLDKSYMKSVDEFWAAIQDPNRFARFFKSLSESWVPNIVKQTARAADPFIRENKIWGAKKRTDDGESTMSRTVRRAAAGNFPTASNPFMPPPKRNMIGQEVQKLGGAGPAGFMMRLLSPVQFGKLTQNTPKELVRFDQKLLVLAEKGDPNKYLPRQADPSYSITLEDGTKKTVYMSDAEKDKFDRLAGQYLWERMQEADYFTKDGPLDAEDVKQFKKDVRDARAEAKEELKWDAEEEEAD